MLRILVNAYACSPNRGSEPGMAWKWCVNLAKYCELHIITEGEFKEDIETALQTLPCGDKMHFYYLPIGGEDDARSVKIRKRCWNQGDWRFYLDYAKWQKRALEVARKIIAQQHIDILHQLNMIGFREPGCLWKIENIPYIWGPTNAKEAFPVTYLDGAPFRKKAFIYVKNLITRFQLRSSRKVHEAARRADAVIAASTDSANSIRKFLDINPIIINESACEPQTNGIERRGNTDSLVLLWVGRFIFTKQLSLALKILSKLTNINVQLHIVGDNNLDSYQEEAKKLGVAELCIWHGMVSHDEVQQMMRDSDMLLFTSVAEGTPHVVLEAIANGLPVLCFDTCGQGDCVNEKVGIKIPLTNPRQSVRDFAEKIEYLYHHREVLQTMSENCKKRAEELSWENKARKMVSLYEQVLKKT